MMAPHQARGWLWPCMLSVWVALVLTACTLDQPRATPQDALFELPSQVNVKYKDTLQILHQQEVADGLVVLYRWQTDEAAAQGTYCVGSTFLTIHEHLGWQAHSSGYFVGDTVSLPRCNFAAPIDLKTIYYSGGKTIPVTTVYGLSDIGSNVRVTWRDGHISNLAIEKGSFLVSREGHVKPRRVEVLDTDDTIVASETW